MEGREYIEELLAIARDIDGMNNPPVSRGGVMRKPNAKPASAQALVAAGLLMVAHRIDEATGSKGAGSTGRMKRRPRKLSEMTPEERAEYDERQNYKYRGD